MKRKIRIALAGFVFLSLAGIFFLVYENQANKAAPAVSESVEPSENTVTADKVQYSGTRDGRLEWELTADGATQFEGGDSIALTGVRLIFYSMDGATHSLSGREGTYNGGLGIIEVTGDVVALLSGGYRLETEVLHYSTKSKKVYSDRPVKISSESFYVTGKGIEIDVEKGTLSVHRDVRTTLRNAFI